MYAAFCNYLVHNFPLYLSTLSQRAAFSSTTASRELVREEAFHMSTANLLLAILKERKVVTTLEEVFEGVKRDLVENDPTELLLKLDDVTSYVKATLFEDLVISRLPRPLVTTAQDLAEAFIQQVLLRNDGGFQDGYRDFKKVALAGILSERCSPPFVCFSYDCSEKFDLREWGDSLLWEHDGDYALSLNGILHASRPFDLDSETQEEQPHIVYATLVGYCTARALELAMNEIATVLPSLLRSFHVLADMQLQEDLIRVIEQLNKSLTSLDRVEVAPPAESSTSEPAEYRKDLKSSSRNLEKEPVESSDEINFDDPWGGVSYLQRLPGLLNAYFDSPSKKDSASNRIRNAVHLLSNADDQKRHAVGLALSICAMESLLCDRHADVGKMLAERVANLLEPDPRQRFNAITYVKNLYDARSRILHGSATEADEMLRENARRLAAGVLVAFLDRRDFVRRFGDHSDEAPTALFAQLDAHRYTEGQFQGVMNSPVCSFWRAR